MAEQGYLAITDITGYTAYLNESELEHAHALAEDPAFKEVLSGEPLLYTMDLHGLLPVA